MEDLKDLKNLVKKLEIETDNEIQILQEIGAKLINEYEIKVGDLTIRPLLVEAYYHNENKFPDISVHAANPSTAPTYELAHERQKNHFGELYVHFGKKDGLDVVLSNGEYYLSYLIKNALINGEFASQCKISEILCGKCNKCNNAKECIFYGEPVLYKKDTLGNSKIVYLPRKGISGKYACCPLAALSVDKINKKEYAFTLATGYGVQWRIAVYALEKTKNMDRQMAKEIIKEEGLYSSSIEEKYWMLAEETLKD